MNESDPTTKVVADREFGFIEVAGHRDVFLHTKEFLGAIWSDDLQGRRVEFDVEEMEKGPRAVNVRLL